jgi:integrase
MRAQLFGEERLRDATLVSVLAYAGVRPEEARALRWSDVGERTLRIERAAAGSTVKGTKTGALRTVRLLAPVAEDLQGWKDASSPSAGAWVFPSARGAVWTDYDWRNWRARVYKPLARAVGLAASTPYDLRHSFASLLIHEGVSVVEVAHQLGNAPDVALGTYAHVFEELDPSERVSAVDAIRAARAEFDVRVGYAESGTADEGEVAEAASLLRADARIRTAAPFITRDAAVRTLRPNPRSLSEIGCRV